MPRPSPLPRSATTLKAPASISGVGLFTGAKCAIHLHPAAPGDGLRFRRADLPPCEAGAARAFPADTRHIVPEARRTVLAADPVDVRAHGSAAAADLATVQTVEHLLSALVGLGITDATIDVHGPEVPACDGSATAFVEAITTAGIHSLSTANGARPAIITEPIRIADSGSLIEALPLSPTELDAALTGAGPASFYTYHLDYSNFPIAALAAAASRRVPAQSASIALPLRATDASRAEYTRQVAPARTFCLAEEAQAMRQAGLFAHLTPRDMLVIGDQGPIDNAYRFDNEPARHKLLDLIGDLALAARPIVGRIVATRTGHAQNQALAARLAAL